MTPPRHPRLLHLQILRAVAASLVVVDHAIGSLGYRHYDVDRFTPTSDTIGALGVYAFFTLSGFIMVRQSAGLFGSVRGALTFAWHRVLRIVPLYWLATVAWLVCLIHWAIPTPNIARQLFFSLFFLPNYVPGAGIKAILTQGWTLNYEMAFYALFTCAILLPRRFGLTVVILITALFGLPRIHIGAYFFPAAAHAMAYYTFWPVSLFSIGTLLGSIEIKLMHLPRISLPVSPAWLLVLPPIILLSGRIPLITTPLWHTVGAFAIVVATLCTIATLDRPGRFNRALILCGDASYSTYLTHGWAIMFAVDWWLALAVRLHLSPLNFVGLMLLCVPAANLFGIAVYFAIERPITRALRRIKLPQSATPTP